MIDLNKIVKVKSGTSAEKNIKNRRKKMTEEESFKVYIKRELCARCRFPQLCQGEDKCSNITTAKGHYLAGLEAGKGMAEVDIATIAYMQGAEQYKTKWHKVAQSC